MKTVRHFIKIVIVCAAVGLLGSASWEALHASHLNFLPGSVAVANGDVNADGKRDISDSIYLLSYLFSGGPAPLPLACEPSVTYHNGDVNGSGVVDMSDPIYILNWLFFGSAEPREGCPVN